MRRLARAAAIALLVAHPLARPAGAVMPDEAAGPAIVAALRGSLAAADRATVLAAFDLPSGPSLSARLIDAAVPRWRAVSPRVRRLAERETDPHGPAHRAAARFFRLAEQAGPAPAVAPVGGFSTPRYRAAVAMFSGLAERPWPGRPGKRARFTNRLMGHPGNQLGAVADYLRDYHRALGLRVEEQTFTWGGRTYRNVAAIIPGRSAERVVLADHFDVASTVDYPAETLRREAPGYGLTPAKIAAIRAGHRTDAPVPGADDDASATAALLEAAHMLRGQRPARTIVLLHLNGEEFPGDCAGAREWFGRAMKRGERVAGVVVMDMIGVNRQKDRIFQLAPGAHPGSQALADLALTAAARQSPGYRPLYRGFSDPRSYLYNTDGQVISGAGFPVLLLNEHLNYDEDLERLGYHDEFDRPELFDWGYARAIATTGIATVRALAMTPAALPAGPVSAIRSGGGRAAHFRVELDHSDLLARAVLGKYTSLTSLVTDDRTGPDPDSTAKRLAGWFPESGLAPIDDRAIADELTHLIARRRALAP